MNNTQVAHLWASRSRESAKGSNFFFDDGIIYSYGTHFPIAKWVGDVVLFTTRTYSSSTSKHISYVRRAIPSGVTVFNVANVRDENHALRVEEYMERVQSAFESAKRARTPWKHEAAVRLVGEFSQYCEHFGIEDPFKGTEVSEIVEKSRVKILELHAARAKASEEAEARHRAEALEYVPEWLAGGTTLSKLHNIPPVLRVRDNVVQTSHGAEVSYHRAQQSFLFINAVWEREETWKRNGHTHAVGSFQLESIADDKVVIGCHSFHRSEVERFAKQEGWL